MGTDICMYIEKKQEDGSWQHICEIDVGRNYHLFSIIGNVRNFWSLGEFECISSGRGIPNDASEIVKDYLGDMYPFGASFIVFEEIYSFDWNKKWNGVPYYFWCLDFLKDIWDKYDYREMKDYRIVFGFDQ